MTKTTPEDAGLTPSDLFKNPSLRKYLSNVRDWHGYVRFLGLPDRRDNPDVLIDRLFVEPLLTRRHVLPDEDPSQWLDEAETVFDALSVRRPLVLLGDPGTGKSTLLNYVAWLLARPAEETWSRRMGAWLLPLPMVLRELRFRGVTDFLGLLDAFLEHAMSEPLRGRRYVRRMLKAGRAFILLDGIDELGDRTARKDLRRAVHDGFTRYPGCRWLLSSRIVGYDEVPFDEELAPPPEESGAGELHTVSLTKFLGAEQEKKPTSPGGHGLHDSGSIVTRYIAPFDDPRIEAFAQHWYVQRDAAAERAGADAKHLVDAVHADGAILRLARVPNLLTMMALLHRIEATLPHGRALLYGRIEEAYLESIDKFRGVHSGAYNLPEKRRWLARVGYEMQCRRSANENDRSAPEDDDESKLLADATEVIEWLTAEMTRGGIPGGMSPEEFLDYVGRRSGLFLPRGEGRYAFVHLSFQEYFAAVALDREVTGFNWARGEPSPLGLNRETVAMWAGQSGWRETLTFLFELLASKEDWHADLLDAVFGAHFSSLRNASDQHALNRAQLLARLVVNNRSGLTSKNRCDAIAAAVEPALRSQGTLKYAQRKMPAVFVELLGDDSKWNDEVLTMTGEQLEQTGVQSLLLAGTRLSNIAALASCPTLHSLDLRGTGVSDLEPLRTVTALRLLILWNTMVSDIAPLAGLTELVLLDLMETQVSDIEPLSGLTRLKVLDLMETRVSDFKPLAGLTALESLHLRKTQLSDLELLTGLTALQQLNLTNTPVSEFKPLAGLTALQRLYLMETQVSDLGPLAGLTGLQQLDLMRTEVSDLGPLASLTALRQLDLMTTQVSDLGPLGNLTALEWLDVGATHVSDLRPLGRLTGLQWLGVRATQVADLRPLGSLTALRWLDVRGTQTSEGAVKELRDALPRCKVIF